MGPLGGKGRGKVKGKETWPRFSSPLFVLGRESKGGGGGGGLSDRKEGGHCFLKPEV